MKNSSFEIIAHRGSSFTAPENTLSSAILAFKENADVLECDIHLTLDKKIVVIHDSNIKRTSGIDKFVKNSTLEELKKYDFGSWKNTNYAGEKIPTLEEILKIIPQRKKIFIEIKSGPDCLPELAQLINSSKLDKSKITIMDFELATLIEARKRFPHLEILYLYEFNNKLNSTETENLLNGIISTAKKHEFNGLNLQDVNFIDGDYITKIKSNGLKCYIWTVDNLNRAKFYYTTGVNGIATNKPSYIRQHLNLEKID